MPVPSFSLQEREIYDGADLPMALTNQLIWVNRPLSSLSILASSETADGDKNPPSLWWPSIVFNDYDAFQDFFLDEFEIDKEKLNALIMSRMLQNMRQQRGFMVAKLLGRPIREYAEITDLAGSPAHNFELQTHHAEEFVLFHRLSQDVYLSQIKPEAFIVVTSDKTRIIDDNLFMSYMLALDLASTKRFGGPESLYGTLRSDFRDTGRENLQKLPASVHRLSETTAAPSSDGNENTLKDQESNEVVDKREKERDSSDSDSSDSDSDSDEETENFPTEESTPPVLTQQNEKPQAEEITDATKISEIQVEEAANEAKDTDEMSGNTLSSSGSDASNNNPVCESAPEDLHVLKTKEQSLKSKLINYSPPTKRNLGSPLTPNKEDERDVTVESEKTASPSATLVSLTPSPRIDKRLTKSMDLSETTKRKDLKDDAEGVDATVANTNMMDADSPGIKPDDSYNDACLKMEMIGWTIDSSHFNYFSPDCGYEDIKMNPQWRGKKFFLGKEGFCKFMRDTYGWKGGETTEKIIRKRSNTVTPTSLARPKRSRGLSFVSSTKMMKQLKFDSPEEEEFYHFGNLMKDLKRIGWKYVPSKTHNWHYVLPGCLNENKGGKHLKDFFFEEAEVVRHCMQNNFYERRQELGLIQDLVEF